jgi:hypothetical protein
LGGCLPKRDRPERPGELVPDAVFVEIEFVAFKKGAEFVLEGNATVMFALRADVSANVLEVGVAHGKDRVASLPIEIREFVALLAEPIVRAFLYVADHVADGLGARHDKQDVSVVGFAVDFDGGAAQAVKNAADVRM